MAYKVVYKISIDDMIQFRREGKTFREIAVLAGISSSRVGQILDRRFTRQEKKLILAKRARKVSFMGIDLRPEVKEALKQYCLEQGTSMSKWVSNLVEEKLKDLDVPISKHHVYTGEDLPFGEEVARD
jgi:hypothetical protein